MKKVFIHFAACFAVALLSCSLETTVCSASNHSELLAAIVPASYDGLARDLNGGLYAVYKRDGGYYVKQINYYFRLYPCNVNGCNYYFESGNKTIYVKVTFN